MALTEEKELKKIREAFTEAINLMKGDKLKEAKIAFAKIVDNNRESAYTSIMQVVMRSNVYREFIEYKETSSDAVLESDADYINEGLIHLNNGDLEKAQSYFDHLTKKKYSSPYLFYLQSILYTKKNDLPQAMQSLKKAVELDKGIKVYAYNESDFELLKDNPEFKAIIS